MRVSHVQLSLDGVNSIDFIMNTPINSDAGYNTCNYSGNAHKKKWPILNCSEVFKYEKRTWEKWNETLKLETFMYIFQECTCCKGGDVIYRPVTMSDCTINSEIVFGHSITRTVAEPTSCSCQVSKLSRSSNSISKTLGMLEKILYIVKFWIDTRSVSSPASQPSERKDHTQWIVLTSGTSTLTKSQVVGQIWLTPIFSDKQLFL